MDGEDGVVPATVRAREKKGSPAKAPAPPDRKSLYVTVGQALLPANSERMPIFSRVLRESVPFNDNNASSTQFNLVLSTVY
jgi:hypothetical protein